jgi:hypothetical protein
MTTPENNATTCGRGAGCGQAREGNTSGDVAANFNSVRRRDTHSLALWVIGLLPLALIATQGIPRRA